MGNLERKSLYWSVATIFVAAAVSYGTARFATRHVAEESADFHLWLHRNLGLSEEQETRLLPVERHFENERRRQRREVEEAGRRLAEAIRSQGQADSPEIAEAHEALLRAQAQLQRLTLDHFFAMKEHLDPEQRGRLLDWTHDSLLHGRSH